jgi:AdoMet-dependent heme synthase
MQVISNDLRTMVSAPRGSSPHGNGRDYSMNPALVYWEMTRACSLACRHCRAEAISTPHEWQLTFAESKSLLLQIAGFHQPLPHLILTGGDPLERPDIYDLIDEARRLLLNVSITPSATPNLTLDVMRKLRQHEIESIGLSLDGSTAARHDALRGVDGCFERTISAIKSASKVGLPIQINTLVSLETVQDLGQIFELLKALPISCWSLFFLISVGRGKLLQPLAADEGEKCLNWIYELAQAAPFRIKTTEAPSYRRVALDRMKREGRTRQEIKQSSVYRGFEIRDGHGVVFISNYGDIYPAGFLPLKAGNVRSDHLVDIYRHSPLFCALHCPSEFRGKCGRCEYSRVCGGSRARAFAFRGDPLSSDPLCPYVPPELAEVTDKQL